MTKDDVAKSLEIVNNNFLLGWLAFSLLHLPPCHDLLDRVESDLPGVGRVPGDQAANALRDPKARTHVLQEFLKWLVRSYFRDAYQIVRAYCGDTNQLPTLKRAPWYEFARLMRDSLSHDMRLDLGDRVKKGLLPIEWTAPTSGKKILIA